VAAAQRTAGRPDTGIAQLPRRRVDGPAHSPRRSANRNKFIGSPTPPGVELSTFPA
jgi:hypothetical protein